MKVVVEMANNFNQSVGEDDTEVLIQVVPEELTIRSCCNQNRNTGLKRQEKRKLQKTKNPTKKITVKGFAEAFADLNRILKV